ncbi:hypothetical protein AB1Y20_019212 [Prymnesium parvum]|uniref:Long-chain-alcohol oxidase n=1 Tax=Prymnesium parvum TaxID=97485 RepID=A0AB34JUG5_PRYPA
MADVLSALVDTFLPGGATVAADFSTRATESLSEVLASSAITDAERREFCLLQHLLRTGWGTSLIFLTATPFTPFTRLAAPDRERMLLRLASSPIALHRKTFNSLKRLTLSVALSFRHPDTGHNPLAEAFGYPGGLTTPRGGQIMHTAQHVPPFSVDFRHHLHSLPPPHGDGQPAVIDVDVVIVGSGCGGSVSAAILAKAGFSVLVLEKGPFVPPEEVSGEELDAFSRLYEKSGLLTTSDGAMSILAGACLGGGSTINWACCIPLPAAVRNEWADKWQLPQFATPSGAEELPSDFDASLLAVMERIGATTEGVVHNANNRALIDGCERLGYEWRTTAQNLKDTSSPAAGWTCFGEKTANKQGALATYLADAVLSGATLLERCYVTRVTSVGKDGDRRVSGVMARLEGGRHIQVNARTVVLAAGALHSPGVLRRSGIDLPCIGKHLRVHPVTGCLAVFDDRKIAMYEAAPMTVVSDVAAAGPKADYYGAKIECPSTHTGLMAAAFPWRGAAEFEPLMRQCNNIAAAIVLQRDGGGGGAGGAVGMMPDNETPRVDYRLSTADEESMLDAQEHVIRCWVAAGCSAVSTLQMGVAVHHVAPEWRGKAAKTDGNEALEAYIRQTRAYGLPPNGAGLFSAHQMGTCRMGTSPATSVVDEDGEVWGVSGLLVADDSTFPTASGANPMVTTLAMAHMISTRLALRLADTTDARAKREQKRNAVCRQFFRRQRIRSMSIFVIMASFGIALAAWATFFFNQYL